MQTRPGSCSVRGGHDTAVGLFRRGVCEDEGHRFGIRENSGADGSFGPEVVRLSPFISWRGCPHLESDQLALQGKPKVVPTACTQGCAQGGCLPGCTLEADAGCEPRPRGAAYLRAFGQLRCRLPLSVWALAALGTIARVDSLILAPVRELPFTFAPVTEFFFSCLGRPSSCRAGSPHSDAPPRAMKTASVGDHVRVGQTVTQPFSCLAPFSKE